MKDVLVAFALSLKVLAIITIITAIIMSITYGIFWVLTYFLLISELEAFFMSFVIVIIITGLTVANYSTRKLENKMKEEKRNETR